MVDASTVHFGAVMEKLRKANVLEEQGSKRRRVLKDLKQVP